MQAKFEEMVRKLKKPGADILAQMTAEKADLLHMAYGLVGELLELEMGRLRGDRKNISEECGDCWFYATGIAQNTGIEIFSAEAEDSIEQILDLVKKHVFYGQELKLTELGIALSGFCAYLKSIEMAYGLDHGTVLDESCKKLMKRYRNGYSDAAAKARADKNELRLALKVIRKDGIRRSTFNKAWDVSRRVFQRNAKDRYVGLLEFFGWRDGTLEGQGSGHLESKAVREARWKLRSVRNAVRPK